MGVWEEGSLNNQDVLLISTSLFLHAQGKETKQENSKDPFSPPFYKSKSISQKKCLEDKINPI